MLVPYDPVIPNDPKRVLSHNQKVKHLSFDVVFICTLLFLNQDCQHSKYNYIPCPPRIDVFDIRIWSRHVLDTYGAVGYLRCPQ